MSEKRETRNNTNKAVDYPIIYSYIYEREREDIKRLAGQFKNTRKTATKPIPRRIVGFKIEDGKAIPIYSEKVTVSAGAIPARSRGVVAKIGVVKKKSAATTKATKRVNVRKNTKSDNQNEEK